MRTLTLESIIAGTAGALAMMPAGLVFRALDMRVGHYGPKFAELYMSAPGPVALFFQHLVLGWISAIPLCLFSLSKRSLAYTLVLGCAYGALYYVLINSFALPVYFGDSLPWSLGISVVFPSLAIHMIFGAVVAASIKIWRSRHGAA